MLVLVQPYPQDGPALLAALVNAPATRPYNAPAYPKGQTMVPSSLSGQRQRGDAQSRTSPTIQTDALQRHFPGRPRLGDMGRDLVEQLAPTGPGHRPRGAAQALEVVGNQLVIAHGVSFCREPRRVSTLSLSWVQSRVKPASAVRPASVSW